MKSAATVVFVRKVSQFSDFKKFNSTRTFLLACDVADVPLHKLFSLFSIILNDKTQFLLFHTQKKKIQFFLGGECKSRLYSLDVSTDMLILDSLLVHVY